MTPQPLSRRLRAASLALIAGAGLAAGTAQAEDKGTVHLAYVEWSSTVASTNVMRAVLEQAGFDVELSSLSAAAMWQSVATGDTDALLAGWLPTTHEDYYARLEDQLVNTGVNLDGTKLGLAVPADSEAETIADLNAHADAFDGTITGIDPGAGIMRLTEEVIEAYDLDLNLQSGSGATMTAALSSALKNDENIVVTSWTPHWMFARWDLKYLEDPKGVYGGAEQIHTITRQGLEEEMPEAYAILDAFEWTAEDMGEVMLMNQEEDSDPYENAKQWVADNQDLVQEWLQQS